MTEEQSIKIATMIGVGVPIRGACAKAGISHQTHYNWMSAGERDDAEGKDTPQARHYRRVQVETANVADGSIQTVRASEDWRAHAWWLERRLPNEFGERKQITGADGGPIQIHSVDERTAEDLMAQAFGTAGALASNDDPSGSARG